MRRVKRAIVVAVLCGLGAAVALVVPCRRAGEPRRGGESRGVAAHCTNCGWEGEVEVPAGKRVQGVVCPRCRAWRTAPEGGSEGTSFLVLEKTWRRWQKPW